MTAVTKHSFSLLLLIAGLSACGNLRTPLVPSGQSADMLRATPDSFTVKGQVLTVRGNAWISKTLGMNSNPFIISVMVLGSSSSVPTGVKPNKLYIIKGHEVWETGFTNEYRGPHAQEWEKVARTSTVFPAGTRLKLVVQVETPEGHRLVRVPGEQEVTVPN